jgi:hypothetical protein
MDGIAGACRDVQVHDSNQPPQQRSISVFMALTSFRLGRMASDGQVIADWFCPRMNDKSLTTSS